MDIRRARETRTLHVDADDVIIDYVPGFRRFCVEEMGMDLSGYPGSFDMSAWLGVDKARTLELIRLFNEESDAFTDLPAIRTAPGPLARLRAAGWSVSVLTSATGTPDRALKRAENLERLYGADTFSDIVCIPVGASKAEHLARMPAGVWVEDNAKNAVMGAESGHAALLMPTFHNLLGGRACDPRLTLVTGWREIEDLLTVDRKEILMSGNIGEIDRPEARVTLDADSRVLSDMRCHSLRVRNGAEITLQGASVSCATLHAVGRIEGDGDVRVAQDAFVEDLDGVRLSADELWIPRLDVAQAELIRAGHLSCAVRQEGERVFEMGL